MFKNSDEDLKVLDKLWESQRREFLRIIAAYREFGGQATAEGSRPYANSYLDQMKAHGYSKGRIRKMVGLKTDAAVARHLADYRESIGL